MMMSVVAAASWEKDVYVSSNAEVLSTTDVRLDDSTEAKEPETLKEVLIDYTQRTTLHGYAYITTPTPYLSRRIFWAIYICCTSLFFLYYTSSQLQQFLLFEKSSLIEVHFRTAVKFPAVTLCNLNRFRFTPSIEHGWYETASFISNNSVNKTIKFRNCTDDEVMCIEDGACIKKDRICDGFPDCKERSDEEGCDRCQLIYLDDQGKNASVAFNKQYVYYGLLYKDNRDLYISEEPPFIYLYRAGDTWYLANDLHPAATIYAKVSSNEERPEGLGLATWSVNKSSLDVGSDDVEVLAYCDINFAWLLEDTSKPVDMKLDMFTLYNETGHRLEDLLRTCLWKGVPCEEVGNITAVMTNLGLCYTITFKESTIEHAGVGYGLSMVFNIELYEYLSTTKLGIKLLLHEPNIFPNMLDDGLSITPGLVSYIAVEATQVDNLPAPWGTCGELPINYYDVYSISRCYVACETKLLEEDCGCRAFYMPHEDGEPEVCDVQTYLDCAVPALETIRVNSHANYCQECTEPCHKDVFVTSTSFALMMAEFGGEQDLRRYTLSQKLFAAREARFRYIKENYKETMRQFDLMDQRLAQLRKLLDLLAWRMNEDYADITAYSMLVNGDCKTSRDMLTAVRQIIDIEMIKQLEEFRARLLNLLAKQFPHVLSLTEGLTEVIENARAEYGLGTDPLIMDFGTCKADCRTTLEGYDYDGNRSTTVSGFTCQRWDSQIPHQHPYTATYDDRFPEGNIVDASNFCRNPNKEPTGPWCYTTNPDVEREACLVPICSDCRNVGETYRGNRRLTLSGRTCQRWDSQSPHPHDYNNPDYFPDDSLSEASNFCRNPDNKLTGPWCYTTDPEMTWETCAIPLCHDCKMKSLGTDYVGTKAVTRTGRPCQRWDMQYPHNHTFTNTSYFPDHTLADASNFCRNPDFKDIGPWCFTTDPNRIWEPCGIPFCSKCKLHSDEKGQLYDGTQSFTIFGRACQRWDSQTPHSHPYTSDEMFVDGSVSAASNYCRNPDPTTHSAPWCYTTHPDFEWEPCDISLCNDCLETSLGLKYNGNKAITSSNRPCQRWDSQFPHQHPYKDAINFVDSSLFEANNFCRNPDSNESGPWCYTTDPEVEREYCNIPKCSSCRMDDWGRAYKGLANTTKSGLSCQRWDSQSPHSHESFPMDHFPDGTLEEAANYCRNPDLRLGVGPWCYTTDLATVWEECDVPSCVVDLSAEGLLEGCTDTTPACEGSCAHKICSEPDCRITEVGSEYRGKRSFTVSGYRCQRWDAQEPHPHPFTDPALFPEDALGDNENYCRNPDSRIGTGPWCYTTDPNVEWEPCGVTRCSECKSTVQGLDYVGKQTVTSSGLVCQPWAYQYPHEHTFTNDSMFPDRSVDAASHFCRNPDGKPDGPWCYTLDPDVEWETCGIVDCQGEDQVGCRRSYYGDEYKGTKSWTLSGRRCQRWDVQSPNTHSFTSSDFPDNDISDAADYCRNPDRRSGDGPWCFTTDPDVPWEFCGVPFCYETEILTTKEGLEYTGVRSLTMSGIPCQDWKVHKPHPHPFFDPSPFPEGSLSAVSNYCRNPDNRPTGPWCYTVDPEIVWETCGIVTAAECRVTDKGTEYTGNQSRTISGRLCQRWDAQWPHDPGYTDAADFPDYSLQDAANFCRNPTDSATGPWCYTTDPDMEKEACYVPKCDDCKKTYLGTDYTGSRYFTVSGRICQRWDEQNPHQHTFTDSDFPDDTIQQANNYCRNPDNSLDGPWCYTIDPDVEREPCGIKLCMTPGCRQTELGATYRGHHYLTVSGRLCQRWDKQLPHSHTYTDADFFPDETLADASNYCRNPDNDPDGPWCYTVDPNQIRETCNIPLCSDCVDDPSSSQYTGKRSITSSGRVCQRWDSQSPHSHSTTSADLPDASLEDAANYCRNPDGRSTGPWCYTLDPDLETESCGVPVCTVCRRTYHGYDYAGNVSRTISGRPCQRWDKQLPHRHHFVNADFLPDETLSDASNYCRNPDRRYGVGPWCLTDDPDVLWEPCGVPLCRDCKVDEDGTTYRGRRSTTLTNKDCKRWDEVGVSYQSSDFGVGTLSELANFCRNPTVGTKSGAGPWCHASTPEEEIVSCGVPLCKDCKETRPGTEYTGKRSTTASGKRCQRWDSQTPNAHSYTSDDYFPDKTVAEASNYCRNPSADGEGVWCYLAYETGWEYCNVPYCASTDCTWTFYGQEYRGHYSLTVTGRSCMLWGQYGDRFPYKHNFTDEHFPDGSMDEAFNYCRNPNGSKSGLWCYTTDPKVEWEYCPIFSCQDCIQSGRPYSGKRAFTISGIPCQRWDQQLPHRHSWTDADFPQDGSLADASNYCRTPDGASEPWCYTLDPDIPREKCSIRQCDDCFRRLYGTEYRGAMSSTLSGRMCQEWSKTSPHYHEFTDSLRYPDATVGDAQHYCRNPYQEDTGRIRPWCFTADPDVEWEYCSIPMCDDAWQDGCVTNETDPDYATVVKYSKYGKPCTNWADHVPVVGRYFELNGHFDNGVFVTDNGTISGDRGLVLSGTCRTAYRSHYVYGSCNTTDWFYWSLEWCWVAGQSPEECVNRSTACGSGDACCFQADLSCGGDVAWAPSCGSRVELRHSDDVAFASSCQFVDPNAECTDNGTMVVRCPDKNVTRTMCCNETCCNKTFNESAIIHIPIYNDSSVNASLVNVTCCPLDGLSPDCCPNVLNVTTRIPGQVCNVTDCTERIEMCYGVIDMSDWYLNFLLGTAYDASRQIRDELYVDCRLSMVEDISTYPASEPLSFNKPSLSQNYCRNPNQDPDRGLWCYVTGEPDNTWQSCDLPLCPDGAAVEPPPPTVPPLPEFEYEVVTSTEETTEATLSTTEMTLTSEEAMSTPETTAPTTAPLVSSSSSSTNASSGIARRCDYYLQRTITRYNESLHKALSKLALSILNTKKYGANFTDEPRYVINKTLLQPIQSNFGTRCDWCSPTNGTQTVIKSLSERMVEWQQTVAKKVTTDVLEQIQQAVSNYFSRDWVTNLKHAIITEDIGDLQTALRTAINTTKQALTDTNHNWLRVKEASQLTREFIDNTWRLECNSQLSKLLKEYEHFIKTINGVLDHFKVYLDAIRVENKNYLQSYMSNEMSLQNISSSLRFKDLDLQMQAAKITIDTHMTTGQLLVNSLHLHINQIYYTMLTYTDPEFLKSSSIYWNYMNVSWSNVSLPSMRDISGIELPESRYGIEPDQSVADRWQQPVLNIANMRKELEDRMADLDITMNEAKAYFDDYLRGNQIDEHFFKKNFLGVEVFCQDMSERKIVESKVYDYPTLLSDVGGVMGLLLGASVITIGEILDLVVYSFAKKCRRTVGKRTETSR